MAGALRESGDSGLVLAVCCPSPNRAQTGMRMLASLGPNSCFGSFTHSSFSLVATLLPSGRLFLESRGPSRSSFNTFIIADAKQALARTRRCWGEVLSAFWMISLAMLSTSGAKTHCRRRGSESASELQAVQDCVPVWHSLGFGGQRGCFFACGRA
jgi:hypothetical protein